MLGAILDLATGIRHQMPCGQSGRTPSGNAGASTRSPLNVEDKCQDTGSRFLGQCQHTDWIGLCWAILGSPLGPSGTAAGGCEWAPFIRALWCLTRSHTALATGTSRHSACGREWGTVQPGWCLTRSHSGRWSDNRWWAILGVATGTRSAFCLWLERRPPPTPNARAASARS